MLEHLSDQVRAAAARADVCTAVLEIYARLQFEVNQRKPICVNSGKCCRFDEYGHRLYITTMELAAFVAEQKRLSSSPDAAATDPRSLPLAPVFTGGGCPFQVGTLCGVHAIRPFGCRIFYCDPSAEQWQQDQYEQFHRQLKQLHEQFDVRYFYVEWRQALTVLGLGSRALHEVKGVTIHPSALTIPSKQR